MQPQVEKQPNITRHIAALGILFVLLCVAIGTGRVSGWSSSSADEMGKMKEQLISTKSEMYGNCSTHADRVAFVSSGMMHVAASLEYWSSDDLTFFASPDVVVIDPSGTYTGIQKHNGVFFGLFSNKDNVASFSQPQDDPTLGPNVVDAQTEIGTTKLDGSKFRTKYFVRFWLQGCLVTKIEITEEGTSTSQLRSEFDSYDSDKNGVVSFSDFLNVVADRTGVPLALLKYNSVVKGGLQEAFEHTVTRFGVKNSNGMRWQDFEKFCEGVDWRLLDDRHVSSRVLGILSSQSWEAAAPLIKLKSDLLQNTKVHFVGATCHSDAHKCSISCAYISEVYRNKKYKHQCKSGGDPKCLRCYVYEECLWDKSEVVTKEVRNGGKIAKVSLDSVKVGDYVMTDNGKFDMVIWIHGGQVSQGGLLEIKFGVNGSLLATGHHLIFKKKMGDGNDVVLDLVRADSLRIGDEIVVVAEASGGDEEGVGVVTDVKRVFWKPGDSMGVRTLWLLNDDYFIANGVRVSSAAGNKLALWLASRVEFGILRMCVKVFGLDREDRLFILRALGRVVDVLEDSATYVPAGLLFWKDW